LHAGGGASTRVLTQPRLRLSRAFDVLAYQHRSLFFLVNIDSLVNNPRDELRQHPSKEKEERDHKHLSKKRKKEKKERKKCKSGKPQVQRQPCPPSEASHTKKKKNFNLSTTLPNAFPSSSS
jgi:hypothetical protein